MLRKVEKESKVRKDTPIVVYTIWNILILFKSVNLFVFIKIKNNLIKKAIFFQCFSQSFQYKES